MRNEALPTVALMGNPNVGKSSVFNLLTGMRQHTGNWSGKTVDSAVGRVKIDETELLLVDLPGAYSLNPLSPEEKSARDFLVFAKPDCVVYVCCASQLKRGLMMLCEICEHCDNVILCINMVDELKKSGGSIDCEAISSAFGLETVCVSAKRRVGIDELKAAVKRTLEHSFAARSLDAKIVNNPQLNSQAPNAHPLDSQLLTSQPLNSQALNTQPLDTQPLDTNALPLASLSTDSQALSAQPLDSQLLTSQPLNSQALSAQPLDTQPLDTNAQPLASLSTDSQAPNSQPLTTQPLDTNPLDTTTLDSQADTNAQPLATHPLDTPPLSTQPLSTPPLSTQPLTTQPLSTPPLSTPPLTTYPLTTPTTVVFSQQTEQQLAALSDDIAALGLNIKPRGAAKSFLLCDENYIEELKNMHPEQVFAIEKIRQRAARFCSQRCTDFGEEASLATAKMAESVCAKCLTFSKTSLSLQRAIDRVLVGRFTAYPVMLLLLAVIFYITISLTAAPSEMLSRLFLAFEGYIFEFLSPFLNKKVCEMLVFGVFRVVGIIISVMLPPMAIFFPLFTLLEDSGYLPRIAFNLDGALHRCGGCGKQALTMCMGYGCNAVGVCGCRIMSTQKERSIAIITNCISPCNGRFPMLIAIIGIFFPMVAPNAVGGVGVALRSLILCGVIAFSVACTLLITRLLSATIYKGKAKLSIIELPPYRKPKIVEVAVRSLLDHTLAVLFRAVLIAAPCGVVIWCLANISIGDTRLLSALYNFLDPIGKSLGLDGVILLAFLLGTPAGEIIVPIMLMCYCGGGAIATADGGFVGRVLLDAGWSLKTAVCCLVLAVLHHPCAATIATIYKETKSLKTTLLAVFVPLCFGLLMCYVINFLWGLLI